MCFRSLWIGSAVVAAAVVGCAKPNEYVQPPPPAVTVAKPVEREIVHQLEFTGSTRATEAVDVRARVNGYLQKIEFEDGADVKAGDVLFVIEPEPFEAALDSAKAALQKAQATLALANADLARTEPLVKRGASTEQELDVKRADVATAKADVASAKAALRRADLDVSYTQVKSPISGRVSRHLVDIGNLVQAETTVLTRVEAFDPIHAYFAISESDVLELMASNPGTGAASLKENPPELYMGLSGEEGFPHKGRLDFAEVGIDPQSGTQMRRGIFPNSDKSLVPGMFVRLRLPVGNPSPGLMVPDRAIATDQRGEYVLVVNDKDTIEYRPVKLGMRVVDMRVVNEGVTADDWIVVNGLQRARPGAPVKPERTEEIPEAKQLDAANDPAVPATTAQLTKTTSAKASATGGN
jgi:RND family efflux transporter MFP subunit